MKLAKLLEKQRRGGHCLLGLRDERFLERQVMPKFNVEDDLIKCGSVDSRGTLGRKVTILIEADNQTHGANPTLTSQHCLPD